MGFGLGFESREDARAHARALDIPHVHKKARARAQKLGPPPALLESVRASPVTSRDVTMTSPRDLCSQFDPAVTSLKISQRDPLCPCGARCDVGTRKSARVFGSQQEPAHLKIR